MRGSRRRFPGRRNLKRKAPSLGLSGSPRRPLCGAAVLDEDGQVARGWVFSVLILRKMGRGRKGSEG